MWTSVYENDVGANDEAFWEWWDIRYDGENIYQATSESDADRLVEILNSIGARPARYGL